jgi:LPXTG-motif cell wall-anchored protein
MLVFWIVFWEACIMLLSKHTVWEEPALWLGVGLLPAVLIWVLSSFVYGAVGGVLAGVLFGAFFGDILLWPYTGNDDTYFLVILGVAIILGGILGHFLNPRRQSAAIKEGTEARHE